MRIVFFDSEAEALSSYKKGQLFEKFTKRLVALCGYKDIELRTKHASLEYDIEASSKLNSRSLDGEAKAHEASISGKEISAFVGKLFPLAAKAEGLDGLFISTSPLTPEGADYFRSLSPAILASVNMTLRTLIGDEIVKFLVENDECVSEQQIRKSVTADTGLHPHDSWLVVGHNGDMVVTSFGPTPATAATNFVAYSTQGKLLSLSAKDAARIRQQVSDLRNLDPFSSKDEIDVSEASKVSLPLVLSGAGWFDYKFPSPPECFIGRQDSLERIIGRLDDARSGRTAIRAIQVLSRSGVGKSSLLLKIASTEPRMAAVTVDGRNLLSPSDLRLAVADLVKSFNSTITQEISPPSRQEDIFETLDEIGTLLSSVNQAAVIQIDQFEAILARPDVFQAILDLLIACTDSALPIVWIMARKNDLAATYDEGAAIDLARLNDLSHSIELEDFKIAEEQELLARLADELGERIAKNLTEAILTFSAGFPWLLKRVCAHIIDMKKKGVDVAQLAQGGLRAEDLFDEDLAGLDESDKAFLRTLAANLPNTASELSRRLENEVTFQRLTDKLNELLGRKLLRLSGNVYDTYNDVFKSYLITNRIPFQARYVLRVTPGPALGLLPKIADDGPIEVSAFTKKMGGNPTSTYNKLRELRLLGFIDPRPGIVALSPGAQTAVETNQVGDYLRKALRANALVARVLDLVASEDNASLNDVSTLLKNELGHIEASEKTWMQYSTIMANWLRYAGIVYLEGSQLRPRESPSDEMLVRRAFKQASFAPGTFIPSVRPKGVCTLLEMIQHRNVSRGDVANKLGKQLAPATIRDAVTLGLAEDGGEEIGLTAQGRATIGITKPVDPRKISVLALSKVNIAALMKEIQDHGPIKIDREVEILKQFGSANWTERTWKWRVGILNA